MFCQNCGRKWDEPTEPQQPPWPTAQQAWGQSAWTGSAWQPPWQDQRPTRPPSPRPGRRDKSPRSHGKGKEGKGTGKNKAKDKGKGKGKMLALPDDGVSPQALPPPPSMSSLPALPKPPTVTLPKSAALQDATPSEEKKLLQALAPHLGALEGLPPNLREQLAGFTDLSHKQESKALHSIIQRRTKAKTALDRIRADRAGYESTWVAYIAQLQELLAKQFKQRADTLSAFATAEAAWVTTLQEVGEAFSKIATDAAAADVVVDESDMEDGTGYDPMAAHKADALEIEHGQQQLRDALAAVQATAQQGAKREGSRTPRRQSGGDGAPSSSPDPWAAHPAKLAKTSDASKSSAAAAATAGPEAKDAARETSKAMLPFGKPPT